MSMRVYEFAREVGASAKEVLEKCHERGWEVGNNFSGLSDTQVAELRPVFGKPSAPKGRLEQRTGARTPPAPKSAAPTAKAAPPPRPAAKPAPQRAQEPSRSAPTQAKKRPKPSPEAGRPSAKPAARQAPPQKTRPERPAGQEPLAHGRIRRRFEVMPKPEESESPTMQRRQATPTVTDRTGRVVSSGGQGSGQGPGGYMPPSAVPRSPRRGRGRGRGRGRRGPASAPQKRPSEIEIASPATVRAISEESGIRANMLIRKLMEMGHMVRINDVIPDEIAEMLGLEFAVEVKVKEGHADMQKEVVESAEHEENRPADLVPRAPTVTFLGHVDHGKTSLLDAIRETSVATGESGGITQHIGAYRAEFPDGSKVVFLDTPGHEAFTAMRSRGAQATDVVVLVVAADDGVMPQTEEAIDHAKAAGVPIIVAINKCDRPDANPPRVKQQLAAHDVLPEEWGGDVVCVETSAITKDGLDTLVEMISLVAQLRELKANPKKRARGVVLDAKIVEGSGVVADILVQEGTLHRGDWLLAGSGCGRVRAMLSDRGKRLKDAGPATPVEVSGLDTLPEAGEKFYVVEDGQVARAAAEQQRERAREASLTERPHVTLENFFSQLSDGAVKELRVILKGDVKGTVEALSSVIEDMETPEVKVQVLRAAVGAVTTSDVLLADTSDAIIVALHVVPDPAARALAEQTGVDIRTYTVIYHAKNELRQAMEGLLEPEEREVVQGHAEVLRLFKISRLGTIAGCMVRDGLIARNSKMRVVRDGVVVHSGQIASLRREKNDAREVRSGFECGIRLENFDDLKVGDMFEAYTVEKVRRKLSEPAPAGGARES